MGNVVVRTMTAGGPNGPLDSAVALAEETLVASGSAATTTIMASGAADEIVVFYPLSDNVRVAFGTTATTSAGPIAFSGQSTAFRNIAAGSTFSVIVAT